MYHFVIDSEQLIFLGNNGDNIFFHLNDLC